MVGVTIFAPNTRRESAATPFCRAITSMGSGEVAVPVPVRHLA